MRLTIFLRLWREMTRDAGWRGSKIGGGGGAN